LSKVLVSANVNISRDVDNSRDDNISINVDLKVGKIDQVQVNVDVSSDLEQVESSQVDGLRARVRESVDSVKSQLDGQERQQFDVDSVEEVVQAREESSFVISDFVDGNCAEEVVEDGQVVSGTTEQAFNSVFNSLDKIADQVVRIQFIEVEDVGCAVNDVVEDFNNSSDQEDIGTNVDSEEGAEIVERQQVDSEN